MSKAIIHAISSSKRFGGLPEDYLPIHDFMDSSKSVIADNRHRVLTHQSWFIGVDGPLERAFGKELFFAREGFEEDYTVLQSQIQRHEEEILRLKQKLRRVSRVVSVRDVGEQHVLEDFQGQYIPTPADYMFRTHLEPWMNNGARGEKPPSQEVHSVRKIDFQRD